MSVSYRIAGHVALLVAISCGGQSSGTAPIDAQDAMSAEGSNPADAAYNDGCQVSHACEVDAGDANDATEASDSGNANDAAEVSDSGDANDATEVSDAGDANDAAEVSDAGDASDASETAAAICTPGLDQTCNDNPAWSSIRGHCTAERTCICKSEAANTSSGRCP